LPTHPRHATYTRLQLLELGKPEYPVENPTTMNISKNCPLLQEKILQEQEKAVVEIEVLYAKG